MKERNLWKMASAVFVITLGVVLMNSGLVANAGDYRWSHYGDNDKDDLFVYADTVQGHANAPGPSICTQTNQFLYGQLIVWRIRVLDEYGNALDANDLKSVSVKLMDENDTEIEAVYGSHPPPPNSTDAYWTAAWPIPADYPSGSFLYKVVAYAFDHRKGTFRPFEVNSSQVYIVNPTPIITPPPAP